MFLSIQKRDQFCLWELHQEWQEITSRHPLSSIIGKDWSSICQWYTSLDKTDIRILRNKVSEWTPAEPQEQKIKEAAVRIFGYLDEPDIDNREAMMADFAIINKTIDELNNNGLAAQPVMAAPDRLSSASS